MGPTLSAIAIRCNREICCLAVMVVFKSGTVHPDRSSEFVPMRRQLKVLLWREALLLKNDWLSLARRIVQYVLSSMAISGVHLRFGWLDH